MSVFEDGTGKGYLAKVDQNNRLQTFSISRSLLREKSISGDVFIFFVSSLNVNTTGGLIFAIKNTSSSKSYTFDNFVISYDGGSTSYNKPCLIKSYALSSLPTANLITGSFINANFNSPNVFPGLFYYWNGTGNGMTGHISSSIISELYVGQGATQIRYDGVFSGPPNSIVAVEAIAQGESGKLTFSGVSFLADAITGE